MGWPKGKPRKITTTESLTTTKILTTTTRPGRREPTSLEKKIAEYLHDNICMIPGCSAEVHFKDAMAITDIILTAPKEAKR